LRILLVAVLAAFLNGPTAEQANSFWDCDSEVGTFEFQAFEDGTGFSTGVGPFTFQETGCRQITFQSAFGEAMVINIEGSTASGIGTFEQVSEVPVLDTGFAACVLIELI